MTRACQVCGAAFTTRQAAVVYCSASCGAAARVRRPAVARVAARAVPTRERRAPRVYLDHRGYRRVGSDYEHRLVARQMLGRELRVGEVVHHRNGVKHDNRPENLEVVPLDTHGWLHANERRVAAGRSPLPTPKESRYVQRTRNGTEK